MEEKLISVIIPVYNVEAYLKECLDSIIHQTYKNLEIIVVDDGSIDGSWKICDEYANIDRRIKVIHQKNADLSSARNAWLKVATWDYIWYVDSDDYLTLDTYESLYKKIIETDADLVICNWYKWLKNWKWVKNMRFPKKEVLTSNEALENFYWAMYVWNKLYKRELIWGLKFIETYAQDVLYNFEVFIKAKKIVCLDEHKNYYRHNVNSRLNGRKFKKNWLIYLENGINQEIAYAKENKLWSLRRKLLVARVGVVVNWLSTMAYDNKPNMTVSVQLLDIVKKDMFFYLWSDRTFLEKCFAVVSCFNLKFAWRLYRMINNLLKLKMKKY